jgi:DNA polymerase
VIGLTDEIQLWVKGEPLPQEWNYSHARRVWVAHNKDTERMLLWHKLGLWPAEWVDSATVASAAGMPRSLEDVGASLGLPVLKQSSTVFKKLWAPRKDGTFYEYDEVPELFDLMYDYCRRDVDVMRKAMSALPAYELVMPRTEQALAVLTDKMNDRGVEVDLAGVDIASRVVEAHGAYLREEFAKLVPGVNPRYGPGVAKALDMANTKKETVRDELAELDPASVKGQSLVLLKTIKTASTAKLAAFSQRSCADSKVHGAMVFHGAGRTGRWSSMGVQLHNLVRGLGASTPDWPAVDTSPDAMDYYFAALHGGYLDLMYSDVTRATAAAMRGFLWAPDTGLLSGDFSQIEARALVTWAGQRDMVEAFKLKKDPYKLMAARIYGKPVETINKDERFMGKQSVLGAGYQVGKFGFMNMLRVQYNVLVSEEESERIVYAYRDANKKVVALWAAVERLAKHVVSTQAQTWKAATDVPLIAMRMHRKWLVMRLPTGRCLWYYEPEIVEGERGPKIVYWGRDIKKGGKWARVDTYGGKLVENGTQAMARDVMAEAMLRLEDAGFLVVLTVHDEAVAPAPASRIEEFKSILLVQPKWWPELPLDVEVQHTTRYQK